VKPSDVRGKPVKELEKQVDELRVQLFQLRMRMAAGAHKQTADLKKKKKETARILTILREKSHEENKSRKSR